jgi:hypothetical protein
MTLSERLAEYVRACFTGLWIESHEHADALSEIAGLCRAENWQLAMWDVDAGMNLPGQSADADSAGGNDPLAAIRVVNSLATPDGTAILVLQNFHRFLQSAEIVQALSSLVVCGFGLTGTAGQVPLDFIYRHSHGDWGDELCEEDGQLNEQALEDGSRLMSAYMLKTSTKIWIITEAADEHGNRATTTILLPEEY